MPPLKSFLHHSESVAFDPGHRKKINFNIARYHSAVGQGKAQYADWETARKKAKNLKWKAMSHLDTYLLQFEKHFTNNGGKVIWANDAKEAVTGILQVVKDKQAQKVVKSKSMATEELSLREHLQKEGLEVWETDLGEFIQQLSDEKPYHIVTPAMHKSKEDVAALFEEHLHTPAESTPVQLTKAARQKLRNEFVQADIGITGANFLLPDIGGIALTENEGNAWLGTAFPKIHIAVVGIDKMIPSVNDLHLFWPLLATSGTGQPLTVYNHIFTGPRQKNEPDGPVEMYVVILDNGRSKILADAKQRESLYCIRCGACLNACPVYKNIGGHSYENTYSGPIGSVIAPKMNSLKAFNHLSYASSLCGNCTEVCPVHINLHNLLLHNRKDTVEAGLATGREKLGWRLWRKAMLNRKLMNTGTAGIKGFVFRMLFKKSWGKRREMIKFPKKSFNQLWQEKS